MKKNGKNNGTPQMRAAYDLRGGVRGKYCQRYAKGTNLVRLEPDVARAFPNAKEVNRALKVNRR
jgi:hypothetical protein